MSEVISFRLDKNNPRDAKALSILNQKRGEGLSVREVLTQALINLDELSEPKPSLEPIILEETLRRINQLLDRDYAPHPIRKTISPGRSNLREELIVSIQKTVKPGLRASELIES